MALHYPVVLMPDGIVWNRLHDGQEVKSVRQYAVLYEKIVLHYLNDPACPLTREQVKETLKRRRKICLKFACYHLLKFRWGNMIEDLRIWLHYAFPTAPKIPV
jgi:hypothetical protein